MQFRKLDGQEFSDLSVASGPSLLETYFFWQVKKMKDGDFQLELHSKGSVECFRLMASHLLAADSGYFCKYLE